MARELIVETEIAAAPETVWVALTAFDAYGEWNPFIQRIAGVAAEGARLEVRIAPPGAKPMTFRPVVRAVRPERELRWLGRVLFPGLFDGEHAFHIEPLAGGRSNLVQREVFRGALVPLLWRRIEGPTRQGFVAMNMALKARAESAAPPV